MSQGRASIDSVSETDQGPASGKQLRELIRSGRSFSGWERHCCFFNTGRPRFANISATSGLDFPDDGRGVSVVDWDLDGDLDLWFVNRNAPQVRFLRNDAYHDHHFLSVRLEGTVDNRDAIGARVELHLETQKSEFRSQNTHELPHTAEQSPIATRRAPLLKTVRAGDGYLAQSSKWVHFGLGSSTQIDSLVVRWPGGSTERFEGLLADHRYRIVQGRGEALPWHVDSGEIELKPSDFKAPQSNDQARVALATPLPMPTTEFMSFDSGRHTIPSPDMRGKPLLVNLWASSCPTCVVELTEFARHQAALREANVEVLAVSVDRISENESDQAGARKIIEQLKFPFVAGWATATLFDQFQLLHDETVDLHTTLPVPCSFLIDSQGKLSVIYKGPVEIEQLLKDVDQLNLPPEQRRQMALPFPGQWSSPVRGHRLLLVALNVLAQGKLEETIAYLAQNRAAIAEDREFFKLLLNLGQVYSGHDKHELAKNYYHEALKIKPNLARAHYNLGVTFALEGHFDKAIGHFRRTVAVEPHDAEARYSLAKALATQNDIDEAIIQLRAAIKNDPKHLQSQIELGSMLVFQGQLEEAIAALRAAIELNPDDLQAQLMLGSVLGSKGDFAQAVERFRRVLVIRPNLPQAHARLGQALWGLGDPEQAAQYFEKAIHFDPRDQKSMFRLSWLWATCPIDTVRNGTRAVELALRLDQKTGHKDPRVLDALAAAYAEQGDFAAAIRTASLALAKLGPDQDMLADRIGARLELYKSNRPFRDTDSHAPARHSEP